MEIRTIIKISVLLLLLSSCGTRRTELEASKTKVSARSSKVTDIDIRNDVNTSVAVSATEHSKESEKDIEVIEEFGDNGQLKKRTTRQKAKQKEKTSQRDSIGSVVDKSAAKIKETNKSRYDSLSKSKDKKTTADKTVATNVGGAGWLYALVITIALMVFFYFWLRKPVKKENKE